MGYELTWNGDVAVFTNNGVLTDDDLLRGNAELFESPNFMAMSGQLLNFLGVDRIKLTPHGVRIAAAEDSKSSKVNPHVRVALVTDKRLLKEYGRMYKLSGVELEWEVKIFDNLDEAFQWLDMKQPICSPAGS